MPDHCFESNTRFPAENLIDFEVEFNIYSNLLSFNEQDSQTLADISLCGKAWTKDTQLMRKHKFIKHSGTTDNIVGITLNGLPIYSGTSEFGYDAYFPKSYGKNTNPRAVDVDACLGSTEHSGFYKYYSFSPCIFETK